MPCWSPGETFEEDIVYHYIFKTTLNSSIELIATKSPSNDSIKLLSLILTREMLV